MHEIMPFIALCLLIIWMPISYLCTYYIGRRYFNEEYKGNYGTQSAISFLFSFVIVVIILSFSVFRYISDYIPYTSYKSLMYLNVIPFFCVFLAVEFTIRKFIYGNNIFYAILNSFFLSFIPLFIIWILSNIKIGA